MKKKICLFLLALCLLLTACGSADSPAADPAPVPEVSVPEEPAAPEESAAPEEQPELSQRERDWIEDIEFLRDEIKRVHMDPFRFCPEEEFDHRVDQLTAKVGELSDNDIYYELYSLIASLGDNHTGVTASSPTPYLDKVFPAGVFPFDGKVYLTGYLEGCEQLAPYLLRELVAVNGVNMLYLQQKADSILTPYSWFSREYFPLLPSFFDWAGCDYKEGYTFQFLNDNQEVESVEVPVITVDEQNAGTWVRPEGWESITYIWWYGSDHVEYIGGKDGGCVQMCLGEVKYPSEIRRYLPEVVRLMEEHNCNKLAIDLRACPGGHADQSGYIEEFRKEAQVLEGKQIYVLTGGYTASAATQLIAFFKSEYGAVMVGEPIGQFSSFFFRDAETQAASILPHSGILVQIATAWWDSTEVLPELGIPPLEEYYDEDGKPYEWENTILPDAFVYQDIEDIRQGKDSVIEWVLAQ